MSPDWIGWLASMVLIATLARQIVKQDSNGDGGVSHWLFIGQCLASVGFAVYSVLVENWVFIVTNSFVLLTAVIGQVLSMRRRNKVE